MEVHADSEEITARRAFLILVGDKDPGDKERPGPALNFINRVMNGEEKFRQIMRRWGAETFTTNDIFIFIPTKETQSNAEKLKEQTEAYGLNVVIRPNTYNTLSAGSSPLEMYENLKSVLDEVKDMYNDHKFIFFISSGLPTMRRVVLSLYHVGFFPLFRMFEVIKTPGANEYNLPRETNPLAEFVLVNIPLLEKALKELNLDEAERLLNELGRERVIRPEKYKMASIVIYLLKHWYRREFGKINNKLSNIPTELAKFLNPLTGIDKSDYEKFIVNRYVYSLIQEKKGDFTDAFVNLAEIVNMALSLKIIRWLERKTGIRIEVENIRRSIDESRWNELNNDIKKLLSENTDDLSYNNVPKRYFKRVHLERILTSAFDEFIQKINKKGRKIGLSLREGYSVLFSINNFRDIILHSWQPLKKLKYERYKELINYIIFECEGGIIDKNKVENHPLHPERIEAFVREFMRFLF